jgi:hypothetical protein
MPEINKTTVYPEFKGSSPGSLGTGKKKFAQFFKKVAQTVSKPKRPKCLQQGLI